jgi:hypothetical protein
MHHLLVGSRFTIGDIRISKSINTKAASVGRLLEKRKRAILSRRHIPPVPKSREVVQAAQGPNLLHSCTLQVRIG